MEISVGYQLDDGVYDVIVVGGGTAGVMAACAAAREHKRVLLLERFYALGGTSTLCLVAPRMTNHIPDFVDNCSFTRPMQEEMEREGCADGAYFVDPQMHKLYLERLCAAYGVHILYGRELVAAAKENGRIREVICSGNDGLFGYRAKVYIDCTGDARLAMLSGCPCECGGKAGNQPMTLRFNVGGVDVPRVMETLKAWKYPFGGDHFPQEFYSLWREEDFNPLTKLLRKGVEAGELTERDGNYVQVYANQALGRDVLWFNCPESGHIRDAVSAEAQTEMVLYSREAAVRLVRFFKKHVPGFEAAYIQAYSEMPGIRESRRIQGDFVLDEHQVNRRAKFADGIAQTAYPVDIHGDEQLVLRPMESGAYYEIPYRCLLPKGVENLLVAGRCVSCTFAVQSSLRIQLTCMAMGEAAGIAAAMDDTPARVDGADVRRRMMEHGATFL